MDMPGYIAPFENILSLIELLLRIVESECLLGKRKEITNYE
jgi:hypothetical protein